MNHRGRTYTFTRVLDIDGRRAMKRPSLAVVAVTAIASAGLTLAGCTVTAGSGRITGTDV